MSTGYCSVQTFARYLDLRLRLSRLHRIRTYQQLRIFSWNLNKYRLIDKKETIELEWNSWQG